jgi:PAT family beta-lactamase induction signal transducer AmpG
MTDHSSPFETIILPPEPAALQSGRPTMRRQLPPWAMGLAVAPLGFYFGFISTAMPILLSAKGVSVDEISKISFRAFSPSFWAFLLCPILDVRFSKRTYALVFAAIAAICLGASTLLTGNLPLFTLVLTVGCTATVMFGNAHGGWMPDVIADKHYSQVGGTTNIANLGAAGSFAAIAMVIVRLTSPATAAWLLGAIVMLPTVMLFFIPLPAKPTRGMAQVFGSFFRDLYRVCRTKKCILGLLCFLSPTACFALANLFSGLGRDYHASEGWVTALNGPLVAVVCSIGCLAGIWCCSRFQRRTIYIVTGFGGAAAALSMIWLPHTLAAFIAGVLAYNFFQGINYTAFSSFSFEIVGPGNPLAGTQIALLAAAANVPISYMTRVDGHFYGSHGLSGMFAADAISSIVMGTLLLLVFRRIDFGGARGRRGEEEGAGA